MSTLAKSNVTATTPSNVMLGAGIVVANLKYESGWTYDNIFGATNGGSTFKIEPEFVDVEADGVTVAVAQLKQKVGEKAIPPSLMSPLCNFPSLSPLLSSSAVNSHLSCWTRS